MNEYLDKLITDDAVKALRADIKSNPTDFLLNLKVGEIEDWFKKTPIARDQKFRHALDGNWDGIHDLLFDAHIIPYRKEATERFFNAVKRFNEQNTYVKREQPQMRL